MFMALSSGDKETQLQELSSIVTGIRLFNRDCGKGGEGIDDCKLPKKLQWNLCIKDTLGPFYGGVLYSGAKYTQKY